jgi:hypothetical protein
VVVVVVAAAVVWVVLIVVELVVVMVVTPLLVVLVVATASVGIAVSAYTAWLFSGIGRAYFHVTDTVCNIGQTEELSVGTAAAYQESQTFLLKFQLIFC